MAHRNRQAARAARHWPWLLAAGPALVVVASVASAWIAVSGSDGVVTEDYYKLGLTINRRLPATPPSARDPGARIVIAEGGDVRVRVVQAAEPTRLRLALRHPGEREGTGTIDLRATVDGEWVGRLSDVSPGLRIVALESDAWRFPVTVVSRLPADIRIGGWDARS